MVDRAARRGRHAGLGMQYSTRVSTTRPRCLAVDAPKREAAAPVGRGVASNPAAPAAIELAAGQLVAARDRAGVGIPVQPCVLEAELALRGHDLKRIDLERYRKLIETLGLRR